MLDHMKIVYPTTLHDRRPPAEICRERGWTVGTRIVGDEGHGPTVLVITAIGEHRILARTISQKGRPVTVTETTWALDCRDWTELTD